MLEVLVSYMTYSFTAYYEGRSEEPDYVAYNFVTGTYADCDYVRGTGRQAIIFCLQRRSKTVVAANLKSIARWKQIWHYG